MKAQSPPSSRSLLRRGFSLTELLVDIVIIIVLAAVVFPMARNMRASANKTECMNRLRGWGVAMAGYATDHDGKVEWKDWPSISWDPAGCSPYVHYWTGGSVDFENRNDNGAYANQLKMRWCPTVAWNPKLGNSPVCYATIRPTDNTVAVSTTEYSLSRIKNPARFMLMIEAASGKGYSIANSSDFTSRVKVLTDKGTSMRHKGTVNALMGDYSVNSMTWKQVEAGMSYWTAL